MPVEQLLCPGCGADLDVPEGVTVLKCQFCKSKLKLAESETVRALTLLEKGIAEVAHHGARAADGIDALRTDAQYARAASHAKWKSKHDDLVAERNGIQARRYRLHSMMNKSLLYGIPVAIILSIVFYYATGGQNGGGDSVFGVLGIYALGEIFFIWGLSKTLNELDADIEAADEEISNWSYREPL